MKSTRYDWKSIPRYGEFFVYRLNLISAKHAAWNSGETAYGVRPTDYLRCRPLNFFPKPSRVTGAKWKHRVKYVAYSQKVHMTQVLEGRGIRRYWPRFLKRFEWLPGFVLYSFFLMCSSSIYKYALLPLSPLPLSGSATVLRSQITTRRPIITTIL